MPCGAPITDPVAEQAADERFLNEQRNQQFLNALHEAEHAAWLMHDAEIDHSAIAFGEQAHFSLHFSVDADPAKMAAVLESMASVFRKAVA